MFSKKCVNIPSLGNGEICIIRYYSCSELVKNTLGCNTIILIMCVLMLTRQNMYIQPSITFKIWFRGLSKLHVFLMGNSPAYMLVPQQVTQDIEYAVCSYM